MKFPLTHNTKSLHSWSVWFAWYPVKVDVGTKAYIVWLENIERRVFGGKFIYRPVEENRTYWK